MLFEIRCEKELMSDYFEEKQKKKLLLPIRNLDAALNDMFSDLSYSVTKIGTIIY